jgi:cysteine desulfurase
MIYLDYNATTPLCDEARAAMLPYLDWHFGNPSSVHAAGREARAAIDNARDKLAALLRVKPNELIFTSGGTESCNLGVLGLARCRSSRGSHVIANKAEHHAVLNALEHLEKHEGFEVTWLDVSRSGIVDLDQLAASIRPETRLVSIMAANNETGVIQPMREISKICRERGVLLHSDMVQSFGKLPTVTPTEVEVAMQPPQAARPGFQSRVASSKVTQRDPSPPLRSAQDDAGILSMVDAASFAAHKFYGPKGAGLLFLRSGLSIQPIMFGGAHENERRPGTENVAAIAGMAAAAEFTLRDPEKEQDRQSCLRDDLWSEIAENIPEATENGDTAHRLANTLNVSFLGLDSEMLLIALDLKGVCASSGSACMVGSVVASHVLLAMGLQMERARSAIRFSLGKQTTAEEIKVAGEAVGEIVERLTKRQSAHAVA